MSTKNNIKTLAKELISIVETSGLELRKEKKKSRITFFNSKRVLSLETRKRYILVHLPRIDYLSKAEEVVVEDKQTATFKAKILDFNLTRDNRYYTYIKIYSTKEIPEFKKVIKIAAENNT